MEPLELQKDENDETRPLTTTGSCSTGSGSRRHLGSSHRSSIGRFPTIVLLTTLVLSIGIGATILTIRGKVKTSVDSQVCKVTNEKDASEPPLKGRNVHERENNVSFLSNATKRQISSALLRYFSEDNVTEISKHVIFRNIRDETRAHTALQNWTFVKNEIQEAGHPFCSLYRDNHYCTGERYKSVLRHTPLYNKSLDLNAFPRGSNIYVEGNSYTAQLVFTVLCNTDEVDAVWLLDSLNGNSLYTQSSRENVSLLLIDNYYELQRNPPEILKILHTINFTPNYIIKGPINEGGLINDDGIKSDRTFNNEQHKQLFRGEFPNALYLDYVINGRPLPSNCRADFFNCGWDTVNSSHCGETCHGKHTCLPGPVIPYAENFTKHILSMPKGNWNNIKSTSYYQEWKEFVWGEHDEGGINWYGPPYI